MELTGAAAFESHYANLYGERWAAVSRGLRRPTTTVAVIPPFFSQIPDQLENEQCSPPEVSAEELEGSVYYRKTDLPFCYDQAAFDASAPESPNPADLPLYAKKAVFNANSFVATAADCAYHMDLGVCYACHCLGAAPGDRVLDMFAQGAGHCLIFAGLMFPSAESLSGISGEGRSTLEVVAMINRARESMQGKAETSMLVCADSHRTPHEKSVENLRKYVPDRLLSSMSIQTICYDAEDHKLGRFGAFDRIFLRLPRAFDAATLHKWSKRAVKASSAKALAALNNAVRLLKPGGTILYCTHSLDPLENELVVHTVLQSTSAVRHEPIDASLVLRELHERLQWRPEAPASLPAVETRKYGCALMPDESRNGPLYICKLVSTNR
ncbi:RNA methyltransferase [Babesia caballi]|uniref:RNA methyltransferase n=1 Tax=Babesia caballi TaxID=5871 RepID=A0AAV4LST2_BABCB|nr:RNA methyltransferase [Babesia caballi]